MQERVAASFDKQNAMALVRATLAVVEPGHAEIRVANWEGIEQQHDDASVLTVEYKINLVAPADGEKLIARGQVVRPGRTLIVTKAEVFPVKDGVETLCGIVQPTIVVARGKAEKG